MTYIISVNTVVRLCDYFLLHSYLTRLFSYFIAVTSWLPHLFLFFKKGRHVSLIILFLFSLYYFCLFGFSPNIFYARQRQAELVKTFVIPIPYHKMWEASSPATHWSWEPLPFILLEPSISRPPFSYMVITEVHTLAAMGCTRDFFAKQLSKSVAPEPEGSSPHSQQPANDSYPEPGECTQHPSNQSP
jgi:hypothetical protein